MPPRAKCRNGHVRTKNNTWVDAQGVHRCTDCPSWKARNTHSGARATRTGPRYARELSAAELDYLRRLIPCCGCGAVQNREGKTNHKAGCPVPHAREGDDGPPEQKMRAA